MEITTLLSISDLVEFLMFVLLATLRTVIVDIVGWRVLLGLMQRVPQTWVYARRLGFNVYSYSHAVSFIISNATSYYLNKYFVFLNSESKTTSKEVIEFIIVSSVSLILSILVIHYITISKYVIKLTTPYPIIKRHIPIIAKLCAIAVTILINYFGYKFLVFS